MYCDIDNHNIEIILYCFLYSWKIRENLQLSAFLINIHSVFILNCNATLPSVRCSNVQTYKRIYIHTYMHTLRLTRTHRSLVVQLLNVWRSWQWIKNWKANSSESKEWKRRRKQRNLRLEWHIKIKIKNIYFFNLADSVIGRCYHRNLQKHKKTNSCLFNISAYKFFTS